MQHCGVFGGGPAVQFLNNSCVSTLVFSCNNARFAKSIGCSHVFSVALFVVKYGTRCTGTNDINVKLLFSFCPVSSCQLFQKSALDSERFHKISALI